MTTHDLKNWLEALFGGMVESEIKIPMAQLPPKRTIKNILEELNPGGSGDWITYDELHALTSAKINGAQVSFNPANGVVVKAFFNTKTGEIKLYPAKWLDIEGREYL